MLLTMSFFHGIKIISIFLFKIDIRKKILKFTSERLVSMFRYFRQLTVKKEILLHITIIFVNCILYKVKVLGIVVRLESLLSTAYIIMWTKRRTFSYCIFSGNITWFLVSIDNYIGVREGESYFFCYTLTILYRNFSNIVWHGLSWIQRRNNTKSMYLVNFMICINFSFMNTYT